MLDIKIKKTTNPRPIPTKDFGFGRVFTDHMFAMDYTEGRGWHDARVVPFSDLTLSPSCMVFHYGQEMFEGLKAYRGVDGKAYLFRPEENARRSNETCTRLCMPHIPEEDYLQALNTFIGVDQAWIPGGEGESLYIRPFMIATEPFLGVAVSKNYLFLMIASPSGMYYSNGLAPVGIWVEDDYVRAVRGGVGFAKTGGNYAASLIAQEKAQNEGYAQVLWLDGVERRYIEEVGAMNIFFQIDGTVVTPALQGSILPGVTRNSVLTLCRDWGLAVEERQISIDELIAAQKAGKLEEVFGTGTAAVITPVGKLRYRDEVFTIADGQTGETTRKLYDTITGIQKGKCEDPHNWKFEIK